MSWYQNSVRFSFNPFTLANSGVKTFSKLPPLASFFVRGRLDRLISFPMPFAANVFTKFWANSAKCEVRRLKSAKSWTSIETAGAKDITGVDQCVRAFCQSVKTNLNLISNTMLKVYQSSLGMDLKPDILLSTQDHLWISIWNTVSYLAPHVVNPAGVEVKERPSSIRHRDHSAIMVAEAFLPAAKPAGQWITFSLLLLLLPVWLSSWKHLEEWEPIEHM